MFGRRRREPDEPGDDVDRMAPDLAEAGETAGAAPVTPETGPYDGTAPDDGVPRLDLGGLLVPVLPGLEVRLEVTPPPDQVIQAVTLAGPSDALQLSAFAAPRSQGIWTEVRDEIATALRSSGGTAREVDGEFGPELAAELPEPTGRRSPARFIGIDGPRWFLRAVLSGGAAVDARAARRLRAAIRQIVVVRGDEAMTVREQIPLRLPREAGPGEAEQAPPGLDPFQRGPEITETY